MRRVISKLQHYVPSAGVSYVANASGAGEAAGGGPHGTSRMMARAPRITLDPLSFIERPPRNTILNIVPQGHEYVVERLGRFHRTMHSGLWFVIPLFERIRYVYNVKEQGIDIPNQSAITSDNVMVEIDGVLFLKIVDSRMASYNIENPIYNLINLAQTTMRSEIGRMTLDTLFRERANLNRNIIDVLRREASEWGIECKRYEIRDIIVSELVRRAMDLQAEAERRKRKLILESEGEAQAEANRAEGLRRAQQFAADAQKYTIEKRAEADAAAVRLRANATSDNIDIVSKAMSAAENGNAAVSLRVAEQYIEQFGKLAKETNTVLLSQPISEPANFSSQALAVFNTLSAAAGKASLPSSKP